MSSIVSKFTNKFFPNNMLGWIFNKKYNINFLSNTDPSYINVEKAWEVYCTIPHLNIVINKKAEMLSNMKLIICDVEGNEVKGLEEYYKFLNNPNPLQSFKEWISQLSILEDLYGNGFIYPLVGSKTQLIPFAMWNLPSEFMKINKTGKLFQQYKIEDIITNYELDMQYMNKLFLPNEIVHTNNNDSFDYFLGTSKLEPLRKNLSVIDAVLKTANVLYAERGGIWMFSHDAKGEMGSIPLGSKEKTEIVKQYETDYGINEGQKRYILTNASMKATPISFPISELLLIEQIEQDFSTIIAMYGLDRDLFPSTKGATNENKLQATKLTYQNTIQPIADDKANMLTKILKLEQKGYHLKASFEHLPIFQKDMKEKAEQITIIANSLSTLINIGYSKEEAEDLLGIKK